MMHGRLLLDSTFSWHHSQSGATLVLLLTAPLAAHLCMRLRRYIHYQPLDSLFYPTATLILLSFLHLQIFYRVQLRRYYRQCHRHFLLSWYLTSECSRCRCLPASYPCTCYRSVIHSEVCLQCIVRSRPFQDFSATTPFGNRLK
eukprot:COSAG05_NODE_689_length_7904_cov_97.607816_10_plen_144_part_00